MKKCKKKQRPSAQLIVGSFFGYAAFITIIGQIFIYKPEPPTLPVVERQAKKEVVKLYKAKVTEVKKDKLINFVMNDIEGGGKYVKDAGGYAKYGINSKYNPEVNVKNLTAKKAARIYKEKYWDKRLDKFKPKFQAIAFDALVNHGNSKDTWAMIEAAKENPAKLIRLRKGYYAKLAERNPANMKHLVGWNNRLVKLAEYKQYASK